MRGAARGWLHRRPWPCRPLPPEASLLLWPRPPEAALRAAGATTGASPSRASVAVPPPLQSPVAVRPRLARSPSAQAASGKKERGSGPLSIQWEERKEGSHQSHFSQSETRISCTWIADVAIVFSLCVYNEILVGQMSSNEKVVNYKVLELIEMYKFDIELIYIRSHLKILKI